MDAQQLAKLSVDKLIAVFRGQSANLNTPLVEI